jgi:hypothetical protein
MATSGQRGSSRLEQDYIFKGPYFRVYAFVGQFDQ